MNTSIPQQILNNSNVASKKELEEKTETIKNQADKATSDAAAAQATADSKVSKSGDTMTGILHMQISTNAGVTAGTTNFNDVDFVGRDNVRVGFIRGVSNIDGSHYVAIHAVNQKNTPTDSIRVSVDTNNICSVYCSLPHEDSYNNQVDTLKSSINRHLLNIYRSLTIFVNAATGSDTKDLFMGRGFSEDKPFATLAGAVSWISNYCAGIAQIIIRLDSDTTMPAYTFQTRNLTRILIQSKDAANPATITVNGRLTFLSGVVAFENVKMTWPKSVDYMFYVGSYGGLAMCEFVRGLELNGTVTTAVVLAQKAGIVTAGAALSGTVTGRRYQSALGGRIIVYGLGTNVFPGTVAGTCDATSVYG